MVWQTLKEHDDYEINTVYPHDIRKKLNHKIIKEYTEPNGYIRLNLNGKKYYKHRLIASQFIPNDNNEHKTQVDHINHNRSDNCIDNLRWCTPSENNKNKSSYKNHFEFVDELPEDAVNIEYYGQYQFDNLYYYDNTFYIHNGIKYRKLNILKPANNESYFVIANDVDNKQVRIYYTTFKKMYGM